MNRLLSLIILFVVLFCHILIAQEPIGRHAPSLTNIDDELYLFGGNDLNTKYNDMWKFTYENSVVKWEELHPTGDIPDPTTGHVALSYQNNLIIIGGLTDANNDNRENVIEVYKYSVLENNWMKITCSGDSLPKTFYSHLGVEIEGNAYISYKNQLWKLNLNTFEWSGLTGPPDYNSYRRNYEFHSGVAYKGKFYITRNVIQQDGRIQIYDPKSNTWDIKVPTSALQKYSNSIQTFMPNGARGANYWKNGIYAYSVGGRNSNNGEIIDDFWEINLETFEWKQLTLFDKRYHGAAAKTSEKAGSEILITGGTEIDGEPPLEYKLVKLFPHETFYLTTNVAPNDASADGCSVEPLSGEYDKGDEVELTVDGAPGWLFSRWSGTISGTSNPHQITMDQDYDVTANFQPILSLNFASEDENMFYPPSPEKKVYIGTTSLSAGGVDWQLLKLNYLATYPVKNKDVKAFIEFGETTLEGSISSDNLGNITSILFSPGVIIPDGQTFNCRFYYVFDFPSKFDIIYIPAPIDEVKKLTIGIDMSRVEAIPVPNDARPGVKLPEDFFISQTQTIASVWNISHSPYLPFSTIREAVLDELTVDGNIIKVEAGYYTENVLVDKSLTIFASDGVDSTILNGKTTDMCGFEITKSNTKISYFTIQNVKGYSNHPSGIYLNGEEAIVENCEVKNNILLNNNRGIALYLADNNQIYKNKIRGYEYGVRLGSAKNNRINKNSIIGESKYGLERGIYLSNFSQENRIEQNVISGNKDDGIYISGKDILNNVILENFIGTDSTGTIAIPNSIGINLSGSEQYNDVAKFNKIEKNIISGNTKKDKFSDNEGYGIWIKGENANNNEIISNLIGTTADGESALLNDEHGILIDGGASNNIIDGNTIVGDTLSSAIKIGGSWTINNGNIIRNNFIGTNKGGTKKISSGLGILVMNRSNNLKIESNLISGTVMGISIGGPTSDNAFIYQNKIGTDVTGTKKIPNSVGISLQNGVKSAVVEDNLISGNGFALLVMDDDTKNNTIKNNKIGTDITETRELSNTGGIFISDGATDNYVYHNIVAGNDEVGIIISDEKSINNRIIKNYVGTNYFKNAKLPNEIGILLYETKQNNVSNNIVWYNSTGISDEKGNNNILNNDVNENTGNTGLHLKNSNSFISGNRITNDLTNGIENEGNSNPTIVNNNIHDNAGFGFVNSNNSNFITADNNWWGHAEDPASNSISGNIQITKWLTSEKILSCVPSQDTLFIPVGGSDSIFLYSKVWDETLGTINISIDSDNNNWLTSEREFSVEIDDEYSSTAKSIFSVPSNSSSNDFSKVTLFASLSGSSDISDSSEFYIYSYQSSLKSILITPDSSIIDIGDSLQFYAVAYDEHRNKINSEVIWSSSFGEIREDGLFHTTNINTPKIIEIKATNIQSGIVGETIVVVGDTVLVNVNEENIVPDKYLLNQNYPNPFNPTTTIGYGLPIRSNVKIEIFNVLGQSVGILIDDFKHAGYYEVSWNAANLPSGVYFISIRTEGLNSKKNFTQVKKALLLK